MPPSQATAAETATDLAPPADDRHPVTVRLTAFHLDYLKQRAAVNGETPERHLETILRQFRSYHDNWRPSRDTTTPHVGAPAGTRPAR